MSDIRLYTGARLEYCLSGLAISHNNDISGLGFEYPTRWLCLSLNYYPENVLVQRNSIESLLVNHPVSEIWRSAAMVESFQNLGEKIFIGQLNLKIYYKNDAIIQRLGELRRNTEIQSPDKELIRGHLRSHEHIRELLYMWLRKHTECMSSEPKALPVHHDSPMLQVNTEL